MIFWFPQVELHDLWDNLDFEKKQTQGMCFHVSTWNQEELLFFFFFSEFKFKKNKFNSWQ